MQRNTGKKEKEEKMRKEIDERGIGRCRGRDKQKKS
jgi:hypothetical protein